MCNVYANYMLTHHIRKNKTVTVKICALVWGLGNAAALFGSPLRDYLCDHTLLCKHHA